VGNGLGILNPWQRAFLKIPSVGGMARSAMVGFRINNPHQVVGYGPNPPEVPPCPRGDAVFIERGAALGSMENSLEHPLPRRGGAKRQGGLFPGSTPP
jgi:hypothetical protein